MARGQVAVFGGTGFLGRRVVQRLLERDFSVRVASRHPESTAALFPGVQPGIESIHADINDDSSVLAVVAGVEGVVNAVSLYLESGHRTFLFRPCNRSRTSGAARPGSGRRTVDPCLRVRARFLRTVLYVARSFRRGVFVSRQAGPGSRRKRSA